jgi:hypothetical protein
VTPLFFGLFASVAAAHKDMSRPARMPMLTQDHQPSHRVSVLNDKLDHALPDMQALKDAKKLGWTAAGLAMTADKPAAAAAIAAQFCASASTLFTLGASKFKYAVSL